MCAPPAARAERTASAGACRRSSLVASLFYSLLYRGACVADPAIRRCAIPVHLSACGGALQLRKDSQLCLGPSIEMLSPLIAPSAGHLGDRSMAEGEKEGRLLQTCRAFS
mmetsp:Transcript_12152/g.34959  ORF Transcript_12152/g.34959 Transcript_12152/m.34959 type:complete len:110 (+) Transcript_12152:247-576(+)|eukprot:scaffold85166_cov28-Tisochrysis_lutea.AAC.1